MALVEPLDTVIAGSLLHHYRDDFREEERRSCDHALFESIGRFEPVR